VPAPRIAGPLPKARTTRIYRPAIARGSDGGPPGRGVGRAGNERLHQPKERTDGRRGAGDQPRSHAAARARGSRERPTKLIPRFVLLWENSMRIILTLVAAFVALAAWSDSPIRAEDDAATSFFNGKNLDGWEGLMQFWKVEDGALVGYTEKDPGFNTFLCSKKKYKDFELSFQVRLKDGVGNSGVQIRSEIMERQHFAVKGPQADIGQIFWGSLYGEHFGGMMKQAPPELVKKV